MSGTPLSDQDIQLRVIDQKANHAAEDIDNLADKLNELIDGHNQLIENVEHNTEVFREVCGMLQNQIDELHEQMGIQALINLVIADAFDKDDKYSQEKQDLVERLFGSDA